jgi:hypothetical protein
VFVQSEWGLFTRYSTVGQPHMEKELVKKSQRIASSTALFFFPDTRIYRDVLTFVDRSFCLFWETTCAVSGQKTALGYLLHSQREVVRHKGYFSPAFAPWPSACVSRTRMGSFAPIWHHRASTKGKESGQKKSTHDEFHRLGPWVRTGGTRCVLVRSEWGLLPRYGTVCALYMEKNSVNKSQPTSSSAGSSY